MAVSYTHLDVYKRQVYAFSMNEARNSPVLTSQYRTTRLRNEYDVKLFQVQMPKSGYFRITLRPNAVADENDIGYGWNQMCIRDRMYSGMI